jgi:hypothetical protein
VGFDLTYSYIVAGLTVRSDIALPELVSFSLESNEPDIEISFAPVPENLPQATVASFQAEIADNEVLLKIPGVARYHVRAGRQILVEAEPDVLAKDLRLFLLGSALGAIYFQRGFFPLHASVVVMNGNAVAFTGDSGAGKSTMAAWMNAQGYPLLCDDVCVVRFDEHGNPIAYSGFPRLKLWNDALNAFDIDASKLQSDYSRANKYHLPVSGRFWTDPVPLRHINILRFSDSISEPRIEDIKPAQAVHLLRNNTYRFQYISGLGLTESHFLDCVKLARSTGLHFLTRSKQHAALAECQGLIERQMI